MKPLGNCVVVTGALAAALVSAPLLAAPTFGNDDLKGEYLFVVVEVHTVTIPPAGPRPEHCVIAGSAVFDGAGRATLNATQRCNLSGSGEMSGTQFYSVKPDGSFLMSESAGMADPVHGQMVDHGRTLLLDGTTRTLSEIIGWWGTAVRR